jgi:hypothetical protein
VMAAAIAAGLDGNLCRCTGWRPIIDACRVRGGGWCQGGCQGGPGGGPGGTWGGPGGVPGGGGGGGWRGSQYSSSHQAHTHQTHQSAHCCGPAGAGSWRWWWRMMAGGAPSLA